MKRVQATFALGFCTLCLAMIPARAAEKSPEALEQAFQKEDNPRKQADIARKLIPQRLERLRTRIATGMMLEASTPELAHYQSAIEMLGSAVRQASHTGTSKDAEKLLRDRSHELGDLDIRVSAVERPLIEQLLTKVSDLREEILYGLMLPPPEKSEQEETARK
jgi:hypothetical protein